MLIIDVNYENFLKFRTNNFGFYWCESATEFILAKPDYSSVIRCIVKKVGGEDDMNFRNRIYSVGVKVLKLTFPDTKASFYDFKPEVIAAPEKEKTPLKTTQKLSSYGINGIGGMQ